MEENNLTSNQEEVKDTGETTNNEEPKISYEKLLELERNKTIALHKEREEKKKILERLSELEAKEKEAQEKEMKRKGQYEELLKEKDALISELQEKAKAYDEYIEAKQKQINDTIEKLMGEIPKETIDEYQDILEDLKDEKKIKFLEKLLNQTKKNDFDPEIKNGEKNSLQKNDIDINNAKKDGLDSFLTAMIKGNI